MKVLDLFLPAFMPVLKMLLVTAVGLILANDRVDVLGVDARKHVNNLAFFAFNPSLVGSSLAESITSRSLVKLWFMPLNILFTFIIGSALGFLLVKITRAPKHLCGLVVGCCSAGNVGYMVLIIVPAVCKEKGAPFGNADVCSKHALAYASLSMAVGAIYIWTYVYNVMRIYATKVSEETRLSDTINCENPALTVDDVSKHHTVLPSPLNDSSVNDGCMNHLEVELGRIETNAKAKVTSLKKVRQRTQMIVRKLNLKRMFAPSTIGAIIGLIVGTVPPFKKVLVGHNAPLRVVQDSAHLIGDAAIPTVTLLMGANLLKGLKVSTVQPSVLVGIIAVRYIILPVIGVGIVKSATHLGIIHEDPLYLFVLLIQYAVPPAMNLGTMSQLFGTGETECSVVLTVTYALASIFTHTLVCILYVACCMTVINLQKKKLSLLFTT